MNETVDDFGTRAIASSRRTVRTALLSALLVLLGVTAFVAGTSTDAHAATAAATRKVVVRPVTAHGYPVKGYRVVTEKLTVDCYGRSHVAVDAGIVECGSTADYTVACWKSHTAGRLLCLRDPFSHTLTSVRLSGKFPVTHKPSHAKPQALRTHDGRRYLVRYSGAGSTPKDHPSWIWFYFERKTFKHDVFGPRGGDGINRTHSRWTVVTYVGDASRPGVRHSVDNAYYVGTAR